MKSLSFFLFILLPGFMNGCEDSAINTHFTDNTKQVFPVNKQTTAVKQTRQDVPIKKAKTKIKKQVVKQLVKKAPKYKIKQQKRRVKQSLANADQAEIQKKLDLSLQFNFYPPTASGNTSSHNKRAYLPDLFTTKKNKNNYPLQVDGKIIQREEQEKDKERISDGVGLDFKLLP